MQEIESWLYYGTGVCGPSPPLHWGCRGTLGSFTAGGGGWEVLTRSRGAVCVGALESRGAMAELYFTLEVIPGTIMKL